MVQKLKKKERKKGFFSEYFLLLNILLLILEMLQFPRAYFFSRTSQTQMNVEQLAIYFFVELSSQVKQIYLLGRMSESKGKMCH